MPATRRSRLRLTSGLALALFGVLLSGLTPSVHAAVSRSKQGAALRFSIKPAQHRLTVRVTTKPKAACALKVSAHGKSASLPKRKANGKGKVTFTWGVPVNAPSGRWTFAVRCSRAGKIYRLKRTVTILTGGDGTDTLVEGGSLTPQAPGKGGGVPVVRVAVPDKRGARDPGDDYPAELKNRAQDSVADQWGEYNRECTSFVAWALATRNGFNMPFNDDATGWGPDARHRGYAVNSTPAKGAVAWSPSGHVAYVQDVVGGQVHIEEYNHFYPSNPGTYSTRTVPAGNFQYIHFADSSSSGAPAGAPGAGTPGSSSLPLPAPARDLTLIRSGDGTGTGRVEVHYDTAASGFQHRGGDWGSTFATDGPSGDPGDHWQMADMDGDGRPDLVLIQSRNGTGTGRVEVHFDTAASGFQHRGGDWGSTFATDGGDPGDHWQMADMDGDGRPDLVLIRSGDGTGTGRVEVHYDTAASGFQHRGGDWGSTFATDGPSGDPGDHWQMADMDGDGRPDLVLIQSRNGTGTGRVEVHFDTAASGFQHRGGDWGSTFATDGGDPGDHWQMADMDGDGRPDLVLIRSGDGTGTGRVEVHYDTAASGFQHRGGDWGSTFATDGPSGDPGDHWQLAAFP